MKLRLDGRSLVLDDFAPLLGGSDRPLSLSLTADAKKAVARARALVDRVVDSGEVVYGLTTGFGRLKNVAIETADLAALQRNLVLSHCCGVGDPLPFEEVRAVMALRINGLSRGHSGVRPELLATWIELFNAGFTPEVPQQGSVGASGDLAPLSHLCAATMGVGRAALPDGKGGWKVTSAKAALAKVGVAPIELAAKEGLALINGTEVMKGIGALVLLRARNLSKAADAIAALSIEALFGSVKPFDPRLAELKNNAGHGRTSSNVRALLADSEVLASHTGCDRVQDPYCLRCVPQVHGAFKTALEHVEAVFAGELNAVTDNPILFPDTDEVISAGQFHGQPISIPMDYLAAALCTIANVSERRIEQLVNPDLSRLPAFLTPRPGLNSGLMIAQVAAASLASENKSLAHPASVDTVPTSANQEDHVSMGTIAARKARAILDNVENVLAIELLCAAQGREFHGELRAGRGAQAVHDALRTVVKPLGDDRYMAGDIAAARRLVRSGELVRATEKALRAPLLS
ncbi:Histidine ammonia-lyase [Planctomycetes bacterium Pla163]|uniref:Histidine ammonia-lyase n=1 Tax=Rohdeia mirabilis TaxID=2528008 RepID=A0A518D2C5_9BACT|nr:Histidine ammonia-lyase [Planctomycetes bacterium Pla163]